MGQITMKWKFESQGLGWHVTRIFLKGEDLNEKLKSFPKMPKLGEVVSKLV